MLLALALLLLLLLLLALLASLLLLHRLGSGALPADLEHGAVLLVTAHPDDESMFFVPSVLALRARLHILCLSTGNSEGLGVRRSGELRRAAAALGLRRHQVTLVHDEKRLGDGMERVWPPEEIRRHVRAHVARLQRYQAPSTAANVTVLTFDSGGVSSHPNHVAIAAALGGGALQAPVFALRTLPLPLKYSSVVGAALAALAARAAGGGGGGGAGRRCAVVAALQPRAAIDAMRAHESQFVWYRRLFVAFSSYVYVNVLDYVD